MSSTDTAKPRVVVLGGGFSGAFSAKALRRQLPKDVDVELISERNYFVFQPLLPEVAAGTINAMDAVTPLRLMLPRVRVRMGSVRDIDFATRRIELVQGSRRVPISLGYDHLVLALGQQTRLDRFPGFTEHSLTMRDLADAHGLRNHVIRCLEHADVTSSTALKRQLLTFVVAGGGFSGVEIVGELQDMIARTLRNYPNIALDEVRLIIVQRGDRLLPELPPKLGAYAEKKLDGRGVTVMLGTSLMRATCTAVFTDGGERIDTQTLITTIGNGPSPLVENLDLPLQRGKIATDPTLAVRGFDAVWAVGDAAAIPIGDASIAPPTAQYAVREARTVARNISAVLGGREPTAFTYKPRGTMASIGHYQAVAEVLGMRLSGLPAWFLWRGFYLSMVPGLSTRTRVALNWLFDYFLPRSIVQITTGARRGVRLVHYAEGDVLFEPGQIVDGFYTVVSGTLESRVASARSDEDFVRILGPGEHWGERTLTRGFRTQGRLTAVDDASVLVLEREDFTLLCDGLPPFGDYLARIPQKIYPRGLRDDVQA